MYYVDFAGIFGRLFGFFSGSDGGLIGNADLALFWLGFISMSLSIIFIMGITYLLIKINEAGAAEKDMYVPVLQSGETASMVNESWQNVLRYMSSENPSDWKFAIIEADTMLDEMLKRMGLPGESLGERLKAIDPADFNTLGEAWEAHKARNQIAHQTGAEISQREARRVIDLYERVFSEFSYI
jgi:hypothetical protein